MYDKRGSGQWVRIVASDGVVVVHADFGARN